MWHDNWLRRMSERACNLLSEDTVAVAAEAQFSSTSSLIFVFSSSLLPLRKLYLSLFGSRRLDAVLFHAHSNKLVQVTFVFVFLLVLALVSALALAVKMKLAQSDSFSHFSHTVSLFLNLLLASARLPQRHALSFQSVISSLTQLPSYYCSPHLLITITNVIALAC